MLTPTILNLTEPTIDIGEIYRYLKCDQKDVAISNMVEQCLKETLPILTYKVSYVTCPIDIVDDNISFGDFATTSRNLAGNLAGCDSTIVFGATIGIGMDRLIQKYEIVSPSKAVIMQAIGAERVESLCNVFNQQIKDKLMVCNKLTKPRFSPGYGDLQLSLQKDIVALLGLNKYLGISLNASLLMTPSKSVTSIIGIYNK